MTRDDAVATVATKLDISPIHVDRILDHVWMWRDTFGATVTVTSDGNLQLEAPDDVSDQQWQAMVAFLTEHKGVLVPLLGLVDDDDDWLIQRFLQTEEVERSVMAALASLAVDLFTTPPLGGFDWDAASAAWRAGWPDSSVYTDTIECLIDDLALAATADYPAGDGVYDFPGVHELWDAVYRIVRMARPEPVDLDAWLRACLRPVVTTVHSWLVEHQGVILVMIQHSAAERAAADLRHRVVAEAERFTQRTGMGLAAVWGHVHRHEYDQAHERLDDLLDAERRGEIPPRRRQDDAA